MLGIKMWRDLNSIFIGKKLPKYAKKWREWQCGLGRAENNICGNQESRRNRELCSCDQEPVYKNCLGEAHSKLIHGVCLESLGIMGHMRSCPRLVSLSQETVFSP